MTRTLLNASGSALGESNHTERACLLEADRKKSGTEIAALAVLLGMALAENLVGMTG